LHTSASNATLFYLATGPDIFIPVVEQLSKHGLVKGNARVVVEKPLGRDAQSAKEINQSLRNYLDEHQIYRIDHYLGKEMVQNLLALRFANSFLEPLWNRKWIQDVQISISEQVGVESRGDFYDHTGALRDMVQNHLLQLVSIVAMEPPVNANPDAIRDEKVKVLRALRKFTPEEVSKKTVRGQYRAGAVDGKPVIAIRRNPAYRLHPAQKPLSRSALKLTTGVGLACRFICALANAWQAAALKSRSISNRYRIRFLVSRKGLCARIVW
jgi:glucose-6-phosphate 1-dehydrogenase